VENASQKCIGEHQVMDWPIGTTFRMGRKLWHVVAHIEDDDVVIARWWGKHKRRWFYESHLPEIIDKYAEDVKRPVALVVMDEAGNVTPRQWDDLDRIAARESLRQYNKLRQATQRP
jgi:hypothetical protein